MAWSAWPNNAIRDSFSVRWEKKIKESSKDKDNPTQEDYEFRKSLEIVYHVDCTTVSTTSNSFDTYIDYFKITNPVLYVYDPANDYSKPITYTGTYYITNIQVVDNQNGTSRVTVSMEKPADWTDYSALT